MTDNTAQPPAHSVFKVAATSLVGASIEWYDFLIYATAAALVFPTQFFPPGLPPFVAQIAAYSTFAVGFLARPVGGAVFGHIGDKLGRKRALVIALMVMGTASTLIGLLPNYQHIGPIAPLMLVVLRFAQGVAVGGQWGGAVLLATESAPENRRGFYGSFAQVGVPVGVVLANLVFLAASNAFAPDAFAAWGWRVPFIASLLLVAVGIYAQLHLEETPVFKQLEAEKAARDEAALAARAAERGITVEAMRAEAARERRRSPIIEALVKHPREIALTAGAFVAINGNFYILITYVVSYGVKVAHVAQSAMLTAVLIGSAVMIPALLLFAAWSDRIGRRGLYMAGAALLGLWAFVFFPLVDSGALGAAVAVTVGLLLTSLMYGPQGAFFTELFSAEIRYSGASLGYQIGTIFGGAFAPIIATALLEEFGATLPIAIYMAILCAVSLVCVYLLTETSGLRSGADRQSAVKTA